MTALNKRYRIILIAVILLANIIGGLLKKQWIDYLSKPLIVISIAAYFYSQTRNARSPLRKWILLALLFSWIGDVALMFQGRDPNFFLAGLSSFLIAHIFYIIFFHRVR